MQPLRVARRPARGRLPAPREHESAGEPGRRLPRLHRTSSFRGVQALVWDGAVGVARVAGGAPGDGRSDAKGALTGESPGSGAFPAHASSGAPPVAGNRPTAAIARHPGWRRGSEVARRAVRRPAEAIAGFPGRRRRRQARSSPGFPAPGAGAASLFLDPPQGYVLDNLTLHFVAIATACANNRALASAFFANAATAARAGCR